MGQADSEIVSPAIAGDDSLGGKGIVRQQGACQKYLAFSAVSVLKPVCSGNVKLGKDVSSFDSAAQARVS